ncbi:MAG: DUF3300 domain-containing protein [Syntrophorhabdus sp.]
MIVVFAALFFVPLLVESQTYTYTQEQLDELLAPIALYPDPLLSQILMASTYPTEVADADSFLRANRLTGDRLDQALQYQPWDASVKSLCYYPDVLSMMAGYMDQTVALGDAFLGQPDQVLDTVQRLRWRAYEAGRLRSTAEQRVGVENGYIAIDLVNPQIVYIPVYDPCWVYGSWWWPTCNRLWFWYPGQGASGRFFFRRPIHLGHRGEWSGFRWRQHSIYVDPGKTVRFNRVPPTRTYSGEHTWAHDPAHRRGVAYRSPAAGPSAPEGRAGYRGFAAPAPGIQAPARAPAPSGRAPEPRRGRVEGPSSGAPGVTQAPAGTPPAVTRPRTGGQAATREGPSTQAPARAPAAVSSRPPSSSPAVSGPASVPSGRTGALSAPPIGSPYARQESERGRSSLKSRPESRAKTQATTAPRAAPTPPAPRAAPTPPAPRAAPAPKPAPAPAPHAPPAVAPHAAPAPAPHAAPAPAPGRAGHPDGARQRDR